MNARLTLYLPGDMKVIWFRNIPEDTDMQVVKGKVKEIYGIQDAELEHWNLECGYPDELPIPYKTVPHNWEMC